MREWKKLDASIQAKFIKKLKERLNEPHIVASQLSGCENHYKIKLRASGYRLVYEVIEQEICVLVIVIGKIDKNALHRKDGNRKIKAAISNCIDDF